MKSRSVTMWNSHASTLLNKTKKHDLLESPTLCSFLKFACSDHPNLLGWLNSRLLRAIGQHLDAHVVKARDGNGTDVIDASFRKPYEIDALSHRYIPQDLEVIKKVCNSMPLMLVSCARDKSREHSIGMFNSSLAFPSILAFWGGRSTGSQLSRGRFVSINVTLSLAPRTPDWRGKGRL